MHTSIVLVHTKAYSSISVLNDTLQVTKTIEPIASVTVKEAIRSMVLVTWRVSLSTEMLE